LDPSTREEEEKVRAESMPGKGKRRSARLLKLEEQKNDDEVDACRLDPLQIIRNTISGAVRGKGKRNGEIQVKLIIRSFGFFVSLCLHILASWVMYKFLQKLQGEASSSQAIDAAYTGTIALPLSCCSAAVVPLCACLNLSQFRFR
jgi:hypothetical protein